MKIQNGGTCFTKCLKWFFKWLLYILYCVFILYCIFFFKIGECIEMIAPRHICQITASGVYPTFSVTDIRGFGSAMCLSKKHLWNLFSIERHVICLSHLFINFNKMSGDF